VLDADEVVEHHRQSAQLIGNLLHQSPEVFVRRTVFAVPETLPASMSTGFSTRTRRRRVACTGFVWCFILIMLDNVLSYGFVHVAQMIRER
jgi:hypothetical protein